MNLVELELKELDVKKDLPVLNIFSDGVYSRTIFMPAGTIVVGKKHKTRHLNMVMSGKARVWMDGEVRDIMAPDIIESKEGCRKILYIVEDMHWTTIHPTDSQDIEEIEEMIIDNEEVLNIELTSIIKELK